MKIKCLLHREGGTVVSIDDIEYHFKPSKSGEHHVCDVADKAHIKLFLSIKEGYAPADNEEIPDDIKPDIVGAENVITPLLGSDWEPTVTEYGDGKTIPTPELVLAAFTRSEMTEEEWNASDKEFIEGKLLSEIDILEASVEVTTQPALNQGVSGEAKGEVRMTKAEKKAALKAKKANLGQR